jgi:aspartyl-tRNA(Asn)/glutamyl-tRNA(Gln) amidotransferase subunit A
MCLGAVGTQTGGSIIRPAAYCGIAGYKPTFDRISRAGVVPVSGHLDHVGFFARRITDFALLAESFVPFPFNGQETESPPRLALLGGMFHELADDEMRRLFQQAIDHLQQAGAKITHLNPPASLNESLHTALRHHRTIMAHDAAAYHRAAFAENRAAFGPNLTSLLDEGLAISASEYQAALDQQRHFAASIQPLFEGFDAFVTPATPTTAPPRLDTTGDPRFNAPWSYAGVPTACTPCGLDAAGMPAGLQLVGPHGGDAGLLATAHWCEGRLNFNEQPSL